jgi:hypothetical protein
LKKKIKGIYLCFKVVVKASWTGDETAGKLQVILQNMVSTTLDFALTSHPGQMG